MPLDHPVRVRLAMPLLQGNLRLLGHVDDHTTDTSIQLGTRDESLYPKTFTLSTSRKLKRNEHPYQCLFVTHYNALRTMHIVLRI